MTILRDSRRSLVRRPTRRVHSSVAVVALSAAVLVGLTACASEPSSSGERKARHVAEDVAAEIGAHSENAPSITLLEMVAWWVPEGRTYSYPGSAVVEPLAWSGESAGSHATMEIRVIAEVEAQSSTQLFGESWSAGSATRCFRLEWRQYEAARRTEIPCPDGPAPVRPTPAARPELVPSDRERVVGILSAGGTADAVGSALREAFPQDYMRIETVDADGGVVAAVGIPAERDCILAFRNAAGEVTFPDFRRISLEPGETGCSTDLYTDPPF